MGSFSIWHWLVVLAIVVVIFGTKKLRNVGSDVGAAVRNFKDAMKDGEGKAGDATTEDAKQIPSAGQNPNTGRVIDAEVTAKEKKKA